MNLLRTLASISGWTLVSRILGLAREVVFARVFGADAMTDAFNVAFRIPNLLRRLFAEGAFTQGFVPILAEYKARQGDEATRLLVEKTTGLLALATFVVTMVGVLAAPLLVYATASGFRASGDKFALTVDMLRIAFPYIFFISLTSLASSVLNTHKRFAVPAATPVLLNITFIVFALLATPYFDPPIMALAVAVFVGGLAQLLFQLPFLARIRMLPRPRLDWKDSGVRRILLLMAPAVLGVSVSQLSLIINTHIASYLGDGAVTWLAYADRLMEFPTALLGVALGTVLLPGLSQHYANNASGEYSKLLDWGLRLTLLLTLPAAVALGVLATPLVATLFHGQKFDVQDVAATRLALVAYSVGLTGLILVKILAPGFYARQNIATPVKIALVTLAATQLMNAAFVPWLKHAGLALSIGLAACLNAALLYVQLRRLEVYAPEPGWGAFALKVVVAVYLMGGALWFASGPDAAWLAMKTWPRVLQLAWVVALGAATYFATLWLMGFRPRDFARRI